MAYKRMEKIKDLMNMETVHVALDFWKENGLRALIKKSCHKIQGLDNDGDYGGVVRPQLSRQKKIFKGSEGDTFCL